MFTLAGGTHPVYSLQVIGLLATHGMSFPFRDDLFDHPELFRTKNPKYGYIGASPQVFSESNFTMLMMALPMRHSYITFNITIFIV